jgi:hypothetical protein
MRKLLVFAAALGFVYAQAAFAGSPLKGVDVKLGKNPGGGCAARTTDAGGKADFGVWPKGSYTLAFDQPHTATEASSGLATGRMAAAPAPKSLHVVIIGASTSKMERDFATGQASGRVAPLEFSLDGKQSLVVVVSAGD